MSALPGSSREADGLPDNPGMHLLFPYTLPRAVFSGSIAMIAEATSTG
jgi:hypothetical protein